MATYSFPCILLSLCFLMVTCFACVPPNVTGLAGIYAFGGDIVDNGNNNGILTFFVKANFLPYGIDFPDGPTGRFTNGKTVVDLIAEKLGVPSPVPLPADKTNKKLLLQGVNFGSAGSGIQDITGSLLIGIWSLNSQIDRFVFEVVPALEQETGCRPKFLLPKYLFVIGTGNNDYTSWYILKQNHIWTPEIFAGMLVNNYYDRIKRLYDMGAKQFLLLSVYPVGCEPGMVQNKQYNCITYLNAAVDLFHTQLVSMVKQIKIKNQMPGAQFTIVNSNKIVMDMIKNPKASGFTNVDCACCELSPGDTCKNAGKACLNRKEYIYFDGLHLTEAANAVLVTKAFNSKHSSEVYPMNLKQLTHVHHD